MTAKVTSVAVVQEERNAFSHRLLDSIRKYDAQAEGVSQHMRIGSSPSALSRAFNLRYPGAPITVHAARKWLVGEAFPDQSKLRVLADWLQVSAEWLRYGTGHERDQRTSNGRRVGDAYLSTEDVSHLTELRSLSPETQSTIRGYVRFLAMRANKKEAANG